MALKEFKLPDIGEGIAEGEIVSWKVSGGPLLEFQVPPGDPTVASNK